jgi:hypothetical protein
MKKFIALAACAIALTGTAFAQSEASASSSAEAYVDVPITVVATRDMDIDDLTRGMANYCIPQGQTAEFNIMGDDGDEVAISWTNPLILHADHIVVNSEGDPTDGPDDYVNDQNGTGPNAEIHINTTAMYRFVNDDEDNSVPWGNPTWLANDSYADVQSDGPHSMHDLPPGMGQINVYIGGCLSTSEEQQRGLYHGDLTLTAWYVE